MTSAVSGQWCTASEGETRARGAELGDLLGPGDCVALYGELGAGKTCLTQGIAAGLGVREVVNSPTFVLLNVYQGRSGAGVPLRVYHFDLYRLATAEELDDIGGWEFLHDAGGVSVVEWADRLPQALPAKRWEVHIDHGAQAEARRIRWRRPATGGGEGRPQ